MIDKLQELGLSYYESKVLESVFKGPLTAKELSKKSEVPLGKIYSVILSLEEKGLIQKTSSRPQKIYVNNASETLNKLIEKKEKEHEKLLSDIRHFATKMDTLRDNKSKFFQLGTTREDDSEMQSRVFTEVQNEVCQVLNTYHDPDYDRKNKTKWEKEIVNAVNRGIKFRSIYYPGVELPSILKRLNKENPDMFQVRRSDEFFTRCDIIDGKKILMKIVYGDTADLGLVFIENKKFAKNVQEMFNKLWERAER